MENNRAACAARGSNFFFTCLDLEEGWSIDCFLTRLTYCVEFYRTFILGKLIYLDIIKIFRQSRHYYNRINLIFFLFFFLMKIVQHEFQSVKQIIEIKKQWID